VEEKGGVNFMEGKEIWGEGKTTYNLQEAGAILKWSVEGPRGDCKR